MSEETTLINKPEKRLKNTKYELFDAGLGCVLFVVFQFVFQIFSRILPASIKGNLFVAILLSFLVEAVFAFAVLTASKIRNVDFVKATNLNKKIDWKSALVAVALCLVCLFAFTGLTNTFMAFLGKLGYTQVVSNISVPNFGIYILYVFLMCVCPALFEEFLFRGLILNGLKGKGKHKAVFISAVIFMLMHGGPDQTIHQFILGIVLGYALVYSGSLWIPIIVHFLNNFIALTTLYITTAVSGGDIVSGVVDYSWLNVGLSLLKSLFLAVIGGALAWLCIKMLKEIKEKKDRKAKELALLDKEKITNEDVKTLKQISEQKEVVQQEEQTAESFKHQKSDGTYITIMFVISGAYLILSWVTTLIAGFLK